MSIGREKEEAGSPRPSHPHRSDRGGRRRMAEYSRKDMSGFQQRALKRNYL